MTGANQVSVGTVATLLASAVPVGTGGGPVAWVALNNGTAATVYLNGGTAVTSTNGYPLGTSSSTGPPNTFTGYLFSGDQIYGIVVSGASTVNVLQTGV